MAFARVVQNEQFLANPVVRIKAEMFRNWPCADEPAVLAKTACEYWPAAPSETVIPV
jgi:hypothetical protein